MKTLITALIGIGSFLLAADQYPSFHYQSHQLGSAFEDSKKNNKPILVYYTADWCIPCQIMDQYTLTNEYLIERMNQKYVTIEMDRDDVETEEMIEKYNVCCLPTFQIIDKDGKTLYISEGPISGLEFYNFLDIAYPESGTMALPTVTTTSEFVSGKVDVSSSTYEDLQKSAMNPTSVSANFNKNISRSKDINSEVSSNQQMQSYTIAHSNTGLNTKQKTQEIISTEVVTIREEPLASPEIAYEEDRNVKQESKSDIGSLKKIDSNTETNINIKQKTGTLHPEKIETVLVEGEVVLSPDIAYVEPKPAITQVQNSSTKDEGQEVVSEEVAKGMLDILESVDKNEKVAVDYSTESEIEVMSTNNTEPDRIRTTQVSSHEELDISITQNPNKKVNNVMDTETDKSILTHVVELDGLDEEKIIKSTDRRVEYIQAGAFRILVNADNFRTKLAKDIKNVLIIEEVENDGKMYKVLLGPIENADNRIEIIRKLTDQGIIGFSIMI